MFDDSISVTVICCLNAGWVLSLLSDVISCASEQGLTIYWVANRLGLLHTVLVLRPSYWYQKLGQNSTCSTASKFLVRDSCTSNLDRELGSCAMGLRRTWKICLGGTWLNSAKYLLVSEFGVLQHWSCVECFQSDATSRHLQTRLSLWAVLSIRWSRRRAVSSSAARLVSWSVSVLLLSGLNIVFYSIRLYRLTLVLQC